MTNVPKKVILHCSATKNYKRLSIKTVDTWHKERGFKMVGYHYLIDVPGTIQLGRSEFDIGAHTKGHNNNSIGVCMVGTDRFTENQVESLLRLYLKLGMRYGIGWDKWYGHYEFANKICPGVDMNFIRRLLRATDSEKYGI